MSDRLSGSNSVRELRGEDVARVALVEGARAPAIKPAAGRVIVLHAGIPVAEVERQLVERERHAGVPVSEKVLTVTQREALEARAEELVLAVRTELAADGAADRGHEHQILGSS